MAFFCSFSKGPKSSMSPANCLASAATCTAVASAGITASGRTPLRPAANDSQRASLVLPRGQIAPTPVMTTRRCVELMYPPKQAAGGAGRIGLFYRIQPGCRERSGREIGLWRPLYPMKLSNTSGGAGP